MVTSYNQLGSGMSVVLELFKAKLSSSQIISNARNQTYVANIT